MPDMLDTQMNTDRLLLHTVSGARRIKTGRMLPYQRLTAFGGEILPLILSFFLINDGEISVLALNNDGGGGTEVEGTTVATLWDDDSR